MVAVQPFQLRAQVADEFGLCVEAQALVGLSFELSDERFFQFSFALIRLLQTVFSLKLVDDGRFFVLGYEVVLCHSLCGFPAESEQFVPVVFVLLAACVDFGRQAVLQTGG